VERLVFTLAFGKPRFAEMALGLGRSLKLIGDTTPRAVLTDLDDYPWERSFDIVIRRSVPKEDLWWSKLYALEHTDAKRVLFLDGDSLAFKRLDPIFDAFAGALFGVQGVLQTHGEWYGPDISEVCAKAGVPAMVQFNGGLMYYERGPELDRLVAEAKAVAADSARYGWRLSRGVPADEVCLSLAMARTGIGRHVPDEADFSNSGVGLIGKLDMDVTRARCAYVCRRHNLQRVEPYVFHAHFYSKFLIYWRQLRRLRDLEEYETRHPFGYMSPGHKLRRSLEKRILKIQGRL
jgi:hypothetical protein